MREQPMPPKPTDCTNMGQVRAEIDRIDAALVDLIAERFGYVDRAWQLKHANGIEGAVVPWRIQQVIDAVRAQAAARGLPPDMVDMVGAQWRNMIGWFIQYEEEKLRKVRDEGASAGIELGDAEGVDAAVPSAKS
jgi:isochorismate pyruvate lyase